MASLSPRVLQGLPRWSSRLRQGGLGLDLVLLSSKSHHLSEFPSCMNEGYCSHHLLGCGEEAAKHSALLGLVNLAGCFVPWEVGSEVLGCVPGWGPRPLQPQPWPLLWFWKCVFGMEEAP